MKKIAPTLMLALLAVTGCSSPETDSSGGSGGTGGTGGATATGQSVENVRGDRYCEVLVGRLEGTVVHVEIYNTYTLNECPDDAWNALDPAQIKADQKADAVILNGPRYWLMDAFENSKVVDPTPVTFGSLEMRLSGEIDLKPSEAMGGEKAYTTHSVARTTTWVYDAGKPVYELVDPQGRVFDMQSYSVQQTQQTEATLADLGGQLQVPAGWKFQVRTLDAPLKVTAVDGVATVVQDELSNTYQLSQQ